MSIRPTYCQTRSSTLYVVPDEGQKQTVGADRQDAGYAAQGYGHPHRPQEVNTVLQKSTRAH